MKNLDFFAIDPGTKHCGWAFFARKDGVFDLQRYGVISIVSRKDDDAYERAKAVVDELSDVVMQSVAPVPVAPVAPVVVQATCGVYDSSKVQRGVYERTKVQRAKIYVERPRHFGGHEAARNSGAILKLMFLVGMIHGHFGGRGHTVVSIPVEKWRGQTPEAVLLHRTERRWGFSPGDLQRERPDVVDAIAIGTYVIDRL